MGTPRASLRAFARRYVIALLVTAVAMVGAVVAVNKLIDQKLDKIARVKLITAAAPPSGENFLLLGSDTRSFVKNQTQENAFGSPSVEAGARSDTLMVVHVEPAAQRTLIVSFPRDLWVQIADGHGKAKINAAFN